MSCFYVSLILILFPSLVSAQNTFLQQGAKENIIIERLEILGQKDSILNFSKQKPFDRLQVIRAVTAFKPKPP